MRLKIDKFYTGETGKKKLKEKYIYSYSFSPGFYDKLCTIHLFVKKDMTYKLYLFFYDTKIEEKFFKTPEVARIEHFQESKLPYAIRTKLSKIVHDNFILNDSYYNSKNTFGILDRTYIGAEINHTKNNFSIDLCPDTLDENLFKTESEVDFLKLIESTENWLERLRDTTMELYSIE